MATNKLKFGTETPTKLYLGAIEVTKAYMGETLVYETSQQDELAGTWVFNNTINASGNLWFNLDFSCDGKQGNGINTDEGWLNYNGIAAPVYTGSGWENEAYKTITITSKLSEVTNGNELLAWLQANAVKQ